MMTRSRSLRCLETGLLRITALATAVAPGSRFSKANEVGEALIVFAVVVMAVVFVRRRRSGARARRRTQPPRTPVPAGSRDNYYATTGITTRGGVDPWTNDPSFPGAPDPRWTTSQARNADVYGQLPVQMLAEADNQAAATVATAEQQAADMRRRASD